MKTAIKTWSKKKVKLCQGHWEISLIGFIFSGAEDYKPAASQKLDFFAGVFERLFLDFK